VHVADFSDDRQYFPCEPQFSIHCVIRRLKLESIEQILVLQSSKYFKDESDVAVEFLNFLKKKNI
jgi:hypothetical protein